MITSCDQCWRKVLDIHNKVLWGEGSNHQAVVNQGVSCLINVVSLVALSVILASIFIGIPPLAIGISVGVIGMRIASFCFKKISEKVIEDNDKKIKERNITKL